MWTIVALERLFVVRLGKATGKAGADSARAGGQN